MRKNIFFLLVGFLSCLLIAANEPIDHSLARVEKKSGKLVFMECEPVGDYDVVFRYTTASLGADLPSGFSDPALKRALKLGEKENKDFDGIIIKSGSKQEVAIKFK